MKFIRFKSAENNYLGILKDKRIYDLNKINLSKNFQDLNDFITNHLSEDLEKIKLYESGDYYDIDQVKLLAPFEKTVHDIICVGLNYKEHVEESKVHLGDSSTQVPFATYFSKRAEVIAGTDEEIKLDLKLDDAFDYENELAIVIGKKGKDISEDKALDYVFGFTIVNDFSARNLQKNHGQWFKGKSLDGYTSMGPSVVHISEFSFPLELDIETKINGEVRQSSNSKYMIRDICKLISEFSQGITLVPGDIIATGTPKGVGMGFTPPRYLKAGDVVECEIEGIGMLRNKIVENSL